MPRDIQHGARQHSRAWKSPACSIRGEGKPLLMEQRAPLEMFIKSLWELRETGYTLHEEQRCQNCGF